MTGKVVGRPAKKGERPGGRSRGTPNKVTRDLKQMIEGALSDLGGQAWLVKAADEKPAAFMALLGKTLPRDFNVHVEVALSDRMRSLLDHRAG